MPLSATPKKPAPTSPPSLALPPPHLFNSFSYADYIRDYNATSSSTSPLPLESLSRHYDDSLAYVSSALPPSGSGASAVGSSDPSMTLTPLSTVVALFGGARAAGLKEKLVPRIVTWTPDGRYIMAELDAVFVFEPSGERKQEDDDEDDKFPTEGGPLHGVELRRGRPMAVRYWGTYEMEGGKIKVLRLARWGMGEACAWPED
ncbi:hypothetical protein IWZ01DRAFT_166803 [Phyllosticta capitalensis]